MRAAVIGSILFLLLAERSVVKADVVSFSVKPSVTDPAIQTSDRPHWYYLDRDIVVDHKAGLAADRHELLLWLTGTEGKGHDAQALANLAAQQGYHVITLMYPDEIAANECDFDSSATTFEVFRKAILEGGHATYQNGRKTMDIARADSIENRLIKLLGYLQDKRPKELWNQFLTTDGAIRWESIAVAGHSQGGGHAAFIGVRHKVERVLCFGSPKDYNKKLNVCAPWYREKPATPPSGFFAFNHSKDANSCTPQQMLQNMKALNMDTQGEPAHVDSEAAPYHHSHILYTEFPSVTITGPNAAEGILTAHVAPVASKYADRWTPVWMYMLTEKTQ